MWQTWAWPPLVAQQPTKTVPGSSGVGLVFFGGESWGQSGLFLVFLGDFGEVCGKTWMVLGLEKLVSPKSRWR